MNFIFNFMMLLYVAVYCVLSKPTHLKKELDDRGELLFVQLLFRHGDRTPIQFYGNDPWKDPKYWGEGIGQLTKLGKQQLFDLGLFMRKRYSTFIKETYSVRDIYVESSDVDRTIISAQSFLAGMYFSNKSKNIWKSFLPWQPIPIHVTPVVHDHLIVAGRPCDAFDKKLIEHKKSEKIQKINGKHQDLYDYLSFQSGIKIQNMADCAYIWDTLKIEHFNNYTIPGWAKRIFPGGDFYDSIQDATLNSLKVDTSTPELARLRGGFLLKDIFDRFTNKSKHTLDPNRKMWVYSGHDTTISRTLNSIGLLQASPPVATCVIFEMRNIGNVAHIEIFIRNSTTAIPLHIPNCGLSCPLDDFLVLYKDVFPTKSFEEECGNVDTYSSAGAKAFNFILQIVAFAVLLTQLMQTSGS